MEVSWSAMRVERYRKEEALALGCVAVILVSELAFLCGAVRLAWYVISKIW